MTIPIRRSTIAVLIALLVASSVSAGGQRNAVAGMTRMLNAQATQDVSAGVGTGTTQACQELAVYIQWSVGSSAGGVQVETSHDVAFTGTWSALGTATAWSAANKEDIVQIHGAVGALRTRISTGITGGTVSTWLVCS